MINISVIVPIYNVEQYLNRCIDSILNQTYKDFELILVDDGSPDNSGKICDEYALKDSRIKVIHKQNGGLSDARNVGLDYAFTTDSEWVTFIDSDDWVNDRYLEYLYKANIENNTLISCCNFVRVSEYKVIEENYRCSVIKPENFYCGDTLVQAVIACCKLYKKELWQEIRFPKGKIHEDEFTTYKLLFSQNHIAYTESQLYYYFQRDNSIMGFGWSIKRIQLIDAIKDQLFFFKDNNYAEQHIVTVKRLLETYMYHIPLLKEHGYMKEANKYIKEARKFLRIYSKKKIITWEEYSGVYLKLYPIIKPYYYIKTFGFKSLFKKLFRIKRKKENE